MQLVDADEKDLVIVGDSSLAQIVFEYLTHDSKYHVSAFSVERDYISKGEMFGIPVVPFEDVETQFSPENYDMIVAIAYNQLNRVRSRLYQNAKKKGYRIVSYISSKAFVWRNVEVGENCMIFEHSRVQPFSKIGNNVILWGATGISHHVTIHDNVFVAGHAAIGGHTEIGQNCFIGMNSSIANNLKIAEDCTIGAGAVITKDTEPGKVYRGPASQLSSRSSYEVFGVRT